MILVHLKRSLLVTFRSMRFQCIQAFYYELKQLLHTMEPGCGLATPG